MGRRAERVFFQRTVSRRVWAEGVGIHSGNPSRVTVLPASPGTGLVFVRSDLESKVEIPADVHHVVDSRLATTLGRDGVTIGTVEHLLAALYGLGIDNARIEVDGPEVPILDGSAEPFVRMILSGGGTVAQRSRPKRFFVVKKTVRITDGDRSVALRPHDCFAIDFSIDFPHPVVGKQRCEFVLSDRSFLHEVSRARTFGFAREVAALKAAGFARGGSLDNAVVIDDFCVQNPDGLRYPDEFVRHKVLDALGDLSLLGAPIIGRFEAVRAGHALTAALLHKLLATPRAYEIREFRQRAELDVAKIRLPELAALRVPARA